MGEAGPVPVVYVIGTLDRGGAERHASLLAAGLAESGDEVTVVTRHLPGHLAHEVREGVQTQRVIRPGRWGVLFGLGLLLTLFAFFARRRGRFDVVHVTGIHLGTYVLCRLRRQGSFRVVLRPMGPGPLGDLATLAAQRFWPLWRGGDASTVRHLLGTIQESDNGPSEAALKALTSELGIASRVRFLGFQDPAPYLQTADIFVLPTWGEGISNALLEAMGAGLPFIATRVSGNIEVIRHNDAGLLVEAGQPSGLAEAITRLLEDTSLRGTIGRNARQRVQTAYSVRQMMADYRSLFTQLVTEGTIPAALFANMDRAA